MSTSSNSSSKSLETERRKQKRTIKPPLHSDTSDSGVDSDEKLESADVHDEPVLSHAQKRRRKKEEKRAETLKDDDVRPKKKRKLIEGTSQTIDAPTIAAKRENSVWVGNLSYKTQHEDLREFFKEVGEITRINMPTKARGVPGKKPENRGCVFIVALGLMLVSYLAWFSFAYVDFATPEAKGAAVARSEQPLFGRKLLIKDGRKIFQMP